MQYCGGNEGGNMKKIVIIGGDAAGMSAAARASRAKTDVELIVFEKTNITSYAACGLPYYVSGTITEERTLIARTPEEHRANGIDVRTRHEVTAIDTEAKTVTVKMLDRGDTFTETYDELVIATGASPIWPPFPGIDAGGIFGIHTIPDANAIIDAVKERKPKRAVVVGGGYIGLEMVEAFLDFGLETTLVERLEQPMTTLDPEMGAMVAEGLKELGVTLKLGESVERFTAGEDGYVNAVVTDHGEIPADIVVLGLGMKPNVNLAKAANIPLGPSGAIATDATMQTRVPHVWAAGDCAESLHRVSLAPVNVALGTHANRQGRTVGRAVLGEPARFLGVLGTAVTRVGPIEIGRTGLGLTEAEAAGFHAVHTVIHERSRAHYYPGGERMSVYLVTEVGTGRMLGAQIVGGKEAAKRIDALAVGIWTGMTASEFAELDLGYAPPYSPVFDPIIIAARIAAERAANSRRA